MQDNKEGNMPNYWLLSNLIVDIDSDKLIPSQSWIYTSSAEIRLVIFTVTKVFIIRRILIR